MRQDLNQYSFHCYVTSNFHTRIKAISCLTSILKLIEVEEILSGSEHRDRQSGRTCAITLRTVHVEKKLYLM